MFGGIHGREEHSLKLISAEHGGSRLFSSIVEAVQYLSLVLL
jgi:hypothetical protein